MPGKAPWLHVYKSRRVAGYGVRSGAFCKLSGSDG